MGSLSGALSTKSVTVEFIKVGYSPMETVRIGQSYKPALQRDLLVELLRKQNLVNRSSFIERREINR